MRGGRRQTTSVEERGRSNMCVVCVSHNAPGMQLSTLAHTRTRRGAAGVERNEGSGAGEAGDCARHRDLRRSGHCSEENEKASDSHWLTFTCEFLLFFRRVT